MASGVQLSAAPYFTREESKSRLSSRGSMGARAIDSMANSSPQITEVTKKTLVSDSRKEYAKAVGYGIVAIAASVVVTVVALTIVNVIVGFTSLLVLPIYLLFPPLAYAFALAFFLLLSYFALFAVKHIVFDPIAEMSIGHANRGERLSLQARQA